MIKPVEEIPKDGKTSQSKRIEADIQEAIDKGIRLFEFVGEDYNWKYLASYAGEVGRNILRKQIARMQSGRLKDTGVHYYDRPFRDHPYIRITSIKDEKQGRRVFCEISSENLEQAITEAIEQDRERKAAVARARAERAAARAERAKNEGMETEGN